MNRVPLPLRIALCSTAALLALPASPAAGSGAQQIDPVTAYRTRCGSGREPSLDCVYLRGLVVAETVATLQFIERKRDQRGVPFAVAALDIVDEPAVLVAACRALGQFPETSGLEPKLLPLLLDSRYLMVQQTAAALLERVGDRRYAPVAGQWSNNHRGTPPRTPYDEIDLPGSYASMGFPDYPGMQRFTPGDTDRAVSWWTRDPAAAVVRKLEQAAGRDSIAYPDWARSQQEKMANAMQFDESQADEMKKLAEEFGRTQDMRLLEKLQTLQQQVYAPMAQAGEDAEKAVDMAILPPVEGEAMSAVRILVLEERSGHPARVAVVYRQPLLDRTVIQMTWDLRDYPSAWEGDGSS